MVAVGAMKLLFLLLGIAALVEARDLTIHVFNVGQGASQLVVFPSGYSVLVDLCELSWSSSSTSAAISAKAAEILGGQRHIDVIVATHLHLDHIGYPGYGGIWGLLEKFNFTAGRLVDRDHGVWKGAAAGACAEDTIEWHNAGALSTMSVKWVCWVTDPANTRVYPVREPAQIGSTTQIAPPDEGASVMIVAADAKGTMMKDGATPVSGDNRNASCVPNENDYSVGAILRYRKFTYGFFGDLDGEYAGSPSLGYCYNDEETTVAQSGRLAELDAWTVNHHGSSHSSNEAFLSAIKPRVSVISCGEDNTYGHPTQEALDRLHDHGSDVFLTNVGRAEETYGDGSGVGTMFVANGDVVITVAAADGGSYTVKPGSLDAVSYTSKGSWSPAGDGGSDSTDAACTAKVSVAAIVTLLLLCVSSTQ